MPLITLTQGLVSIVDDEDFHFNVIYKWHARRNGKIFYASRKSYKYGTYSYIHLHRTILERKLGRTLDYKTEFVDHIDENGLNNCRYNLRLATYQQNLCNRSIIIKNTSGVKGVSWDKVNRKWVAQISINDKIKKIGRFIDINDAINAYNNAALISQREFAKLNLLR